MTNRRPLVIGLIAGAIVLCLCLVCGAAGVYFYFSGLTPTVTSGEYEGYYTSGFEVSSFVTCAESGPAIGEQWWLGSTPESGFYDQYLDVIAPVNSEYVTVYVRWRGSISGLGEYGHLGGYQREATVEEVLEMSLDGTC